jgi:hypothetical protein
LHLEHQKLFPATSGSVDQTSASNQLLYCQIPSATPVISLRTRLPASPSWSSDNDRDRCPAGGGERKQWSRSRHRSSTLGDESGTVLLLWMSQTLPGSFSANPRSQSSSYCPIEMQFTTRASTLRPLVVALSVLSLPTSSG